MFNKNVTYRKTWGRGAFRRASSKTEAFVYGWMHRIFYLKKNNVADLNIGCGDGGWDANSCGAQKQYLGCLCNNVNILDLFSPPSLFVASSLCRRQFKSS